MEHYSAIKRNELLGHKKILVKFSWIFPSAEAGIKTLHPVCLRVWHSKRGTISETIERLMVARDKGKRGELSPWGTEV